MKKIVLPLLMIVCFMFCFSGCDKTPKDEYYKETSQLLTEYFSSEEFSGSVDVVYNSNLTYIMEQDYGYLYAELVDVYAPLYKQAIFCSQKYANVFMVLPTYNTNTLKSKFKEVNSKLEDFKNQVETFKISKDNYINHINFSDKNKAESSIEKARLKKFKIDYLNLINSAYTLSSTIYNTYTKGYYNFADYNSLTAEELTNSMIEINRNLALNGANLELVNSSIKVLKLYNNKDLKNDYDQFWQTSQNFFNEAVKYAYENTITNFDNATTLNIFIIWKGVYDGFVDDAEIFNQITQNIKLDLLKRKYDSASAYAEETGDPLDESRVNFFLNYYRNVQLLNTYSLRLVGKA